VMQYRAKRKAEYVEKYRELLTKPVWFLNLR
jgi:hypothetical protein